MRGDFLKLKIIAVAVCLVMLVGCGPKAVNNSIHDLQNEILSMTESFDDFSAGFADENYIEWLYITFGDTVLEGIVAELKNGKLDSEIWYKLTGNTPYVLYDMYTGALDKNSQNYRDDIKVIDTKSKTTTICFVGDVSFADNWKVAPQLDARGKGISGVLSEETLSILQSADIFLLNNEFTYSTRGTPLNKTYTFRANPERVNHIKEMGADIVSLANNHAYDYGADAFADTLQTLKNGDMPYIGGGKDIKEASKPFYFIVNGRKYGFSAATRAEKNIRTPEATEVSSGVMRTYDSAKYLEVIKSAEKECDYNIVYVHWGAENFHHIEDGLYEMGADYIDAGADIVVGAHAHVLQGIQYYKDIPIVYNLGNFLFNSSTLDTGIFEIVFSEVGKPTYKFIPAIQDNAFTYIAKDQEKDRILEFMESISVNVSFSDDGIISKK